MEHSDWQGRVGQKWAAEWKRTDRSFSGLTDRLIACASAGPVERVLDVGCGAGEVSLAIARGHPEADVIGLDISDDLVEVSRERSDNLRNVSFFVADAATWRGSQFAPDLIVSRHGVMFFPDPVAAFSNLRNCAAADARLVFSCFRDRSLNRWAEEITALLPPGSVPVEHPETPGPFAFADRGRVQAILDAADWHDASFESVDFAYVAGVGEHAVEDAQSYLLSIGPAARAAANLPQDERGKFASRLREYLTGRAQDGLVALPGAAWIVSARTR